MVFEETDKWAGIKLVIVAETQSRIGEMLQWKNDLSAQQVLVCAQKY